MSVLTRVQGLLDRRIVLPPAPMLDRIIVPSLLILFTGLSLGYSINALQIVSDGLLEYNTFYTYATSTSVWWHPIEDNMLSASLWTTYLPAYLHKILQLSDPEMTYRVVTGLLVAPLPATLYILFRRYTHAGAALPLVILFATSSYFLGYAMYARIMAAIFWLAILLILFTVDWRRIWLYRTVAVLGVITSHYSTALLVGLAIGIAFFACLVVSLLRHQRPERSLGVLLSVFVVCYFVFFLGLASPSRVWGYSISSVNRVLASVTTVQISREIANYRPPYANRWRWLATRTDAPVENPQVNLVSMPENGTNHAASIDTRTGVTLNPLVGKRKDFIIAELTTLVRGLVVVVACLALLRRGSRADPVPYLFLGGLALTVIGVWFPSAGADMGSMRIPFIFLSVETAAVALWHSGDRGRNWAIPVILLAVVFYH